MSLNYVKIHHGPIKTLDGIIHRPEKIRGLKDCLQVHGFRVDANPVHLFDYCMIELCNMDVFRCNVSNLGFNLHWSRDRLCQTAVTTVLAARDKLVTRQTYLWLHDMLDDAIFNRAIFSPPQYFLKDGEKMPELDVLNQIIERGINIESNIIEQPTSTTSTCTDKQSSIKKKKSVQLPEVKEPDDMDHAFFYGHHVNVVRRTLSENSNFMELRKSSTKASVQLNNQILNDWLRNSIFSVNDREQETSRIQKLNTVTNKQLNTKPYAKTGGVETSGLVSMNTQEIINDWHNRTHKRTETKDETHFLANAAINFQKFNDVQSGTDIVNTCPSKAFMQKFIGTKANVTHMDMPKLSKENNNAKQNLSTFIKKKGDKNIAKKTSRGMSGLNVLEESFEER